MDWDGLCSLRITCKSASCDKLTCVINTDLVSIKYVSDRHQLGRVLHEMITFTHSGCASRDVLRFMRE